MHEKKVDQQGSGCFTEFSIVVERIGWRSFWDFLGFGKCCVNPIAPNRFVYIVISLAYASYVLGFFISGIGNFVIVFGLWPAHAFWEDGTCDTIKWSLAFVRDLTDLCLYSYFSMLDDLRKQDPPGGRIEIKVLYVPIVILVGLLGFVVDFSVITVLATLKSPCMLLKGWHRLFHDCTGRESPLLESICVPFAGLAILLWPSAIAGALLGSMLASIILGFYAAVVACQESAFYFGLCYIVAALSIYEEYNNDILDMPEGKQQQREYVGQITLTSRDAVPTGLLIQIKYRGVTYTLILFLHLKQASSRKRLIQSTLIYI